MVHQIPSLLSLYAAAFPREEGRLRQFRGFVSRTAEARLIERKNFAGHVTASMFIVNSARTHVLLLRHAALERWLQPGGHLESGDSTPLAGALREVREETGISEADLRVLTRGPDPLVPLDMDTHPIPARHSQGEEAHDHHDFRYVAVYQGSETLDASASEGQAYKWVPLTEFWRDPAFGPLREKMRSLLALNAGNTAAGLPPTLKERRK